MCRQTLRHSHPNRSSSRLEVDIRSSILPADQPRRGRRLARGQARKALSAKHAGEFSTRITAGEVVAYDHPDPVMLAERGSNTAHGANEQMTMSRRRLAVIV